MEQEAQFRPGDRRRDAFGGGGWRTLGGVGGYGVKPLFLQRQNRQALRFLDGAGRWHLEWPPLDMQGPPRFVHRPRAIEFAVEIEGLGRVWRVVETSG